MRLETDTINPATLWKPSSVARRLGKDPSMVTYWMDRNMLDYVQLADGSRLIPEESVVALERLQEPKQEKAEEDEEEDKKLLKEVEINETVTLASE